MASISSTKPSVTNISPKEYVKMKRPPRMIDVRSAPEYASGHAPGALNLSLQKLMLGKLPLLARWLLPDWFKNLPKDKPIAVVCLTSHRSPIAADTLLKAGFERVYNISGGMMEWKRLGLETAKGSQPHNT